MRSTTGMSCCLLVLAACGELPTEQVDSAPRFSKPSGAYVALDLGTFGGSTASAAAITNAGTIVGTAEDANGTPHAFRWRAGTGLENLSPVIGATCSGATDVNASGTAVGWYWPGTVFPGQCTVSAYPPQYPFKVEVGGSANLLAHGRRTTVRAINDVGEVIASAWPVNVFWEADGTEHLICGWDLNLHVVTNNGDVYGSGWGSPITGWGGLHWSLAKGEGNCATDLHTDSFAPWDVVDAREDGAYIGMGSPIRPDPSHPSGYVHTGPMVGYRFTPVAGYIPLTFRPRAINERGDIVGVRDGMVVLLPTGGEVQVVGVGVAADINSFGDIVGSRGGRAVLWTRRPDTFPGGRPIAATVMD